MKTIHKGHNFSAQKENPHRKVTTNIEFKIALLGKWGFSRKCIIRSLIRHQDLSLCGGTIGKYLKQNGIFLKDYRNGNTGESEQLISSLMRKRKQ